MRRLIVFPLLAAALLACGERAPVARVSAEPKSISLAHGECATVRTTWDVLRPLDSLEGSPTVFVHLYHHDRRTQRTFDHPLQFAWPAQGRRENPFVVCHSALARQIPADPYVLRVGLYDSKSGERWPLQTTGEELAKRAYAMTAVTVPLDRLPGRYTFSGNWSDDDVPGDQQHPVRRTLTGDGALAVTDAPAPGYMVMRLQVGDGGADADVGKGPYRLGPGSHLIRAPLSYGAANLRIHPLPVPGAAPRVSLLELGIERVRP